MPDLPKKKVGIIACSGEERPEGLVSRRAALKVLEEMRPGATVTICLPLFLAGGEGDRAFARFYPTIAIDGCEKRCAFRGTERYSNRPAAGLVMTELASEYNLAKPEGLRKLNDAGEMLVSAAAREIVQRVDDLIEKNWSRRAGAFSSQTAGSTLSIPPAEEKIETCACGSGIPIGHLAIHNQDTVVVALPLIFKTFQEGRKPADETTASELLEMVKIYNSIPGKDEGTFRCALLESYRLFLASVP